MPVRIVIDSLDFVKNTDVRHGKIALVELIRLHDLLFDQSGELTFQVAGLLDENENPGLYLEIQGDVQLNCHRCLDRLIHHIDIKTFLLLAKDEEELSRFDNDDTFDAILAVPDLDIINLIEDEILLSLAISVHHDDGECHLHHPETEHIHSIDVTKNKHPFAVLAALKNKIN